MISEIEDLKRRVALLENRNTEIAQIEAELLEAARQWARLTSLQFYLDTRGTRCLLMANDAKDMANDVFMSNIRRLALTLLRVIA
jgi:hypothetical protein